MNFLRQGFQKLSSNRLTDIQTPSKLYTTPLHCGQKWHLFHSESFYTWEWMCSHTHSSSIKAWRWCQY